MKARSSEKLYDKDVDKTLLALKEFSIEIDKFIISLKERREKLLSKRVDLK